MSAAENAAGMSAHIRNLSRYFILLVMLVLYFCGSFADEPSCDYESSGPITVGRFASMSIRIGSPHWRGSEEVSVFFSGSSICKVLTAQVLTPFSLCLCNFKLSIYTDFLILYVCSSTCSCFRSVLVLSSSPSSRPFTSIAFLLLRYVFSPCR